MDKNNFSKNQAFGFTSKLSNFEIVNQEFLKCKCYMLATGDNVNGSNITLDAVKKAISRNEFDNKPVVAHLYKDENNGKWRVGGHDSKWVITNTSIEMVDECIPFGVIPESSNIHIEDVLEPDGLTVNSYVVGDIILWCGRYNIMDAAYSDDIYFNQSCEISINDYHWQDNDIFAIDDFTFSALCLLNKSDSAEDNVRPCFPSCRVERIKSFSINEDRFKKNFEEMLEKYKQFSTGGIVPVKNSNKLKTKGVQTMELSKFVEALSTVKIEGTEEVKYMLLNTSDIQVFALDMEDYKPYGFDYVIANDNDVENVVIDFDSKVEMSLSAVEKIDDDSFEEFSIKDAIKKGLDVEVKKQTSILEAEFNEKMDTVKQSYEDLSGKYKTAASKLQEFEEKEAAEQLKARKNEIDALFNKFADKLGKCAEFLVYKAKVKPEDVTVEEVNEKLTLMAGKYIMETQTKKNFSYEPIVTGVSEKTSNMTANKYGHLLDKYMN